jgi:hypothetical protein
MAVLRLATTVRTAVTDTALGFLNAGTGAATIQIRSGVMPATPQDPATGMLLVTVTLADPAAGPAADGRATITDPVAVNAVADGEATWARWMDSSGATVCDCDVTATGGGGGIELSTTAITAGTPVDLGSLTFAAPRG